METNVLIHHGILGQKWGVRRFQNSDGSLTSKGRERLGKKVESANKKKAKLETKIAKQENKVSRTIRKTDVSVSKLKSRAAIYQRKAGGLFTSKDRAMSNLQKAAKFEARAQRLNRKSVNTKARLERLNVKLSKVDSKIIEMGKQYTENVIVKRR